MMRPLVSLMLLAALTPLAVACGDLSQEDLLFRDAVPSKADVEVVPAGVESQAQEEADSTRSQPLEEACAGPTDLKCSARNVSTGLNAITFFLLDLVDAIVKHPPSKRERGRRVWGPFFDFGNGSTARFEMRRINGGLTYEFCLHGVPGTIRDQDAGDVSCDTDVDEDSGLTLLLRGELSPGTIAGAGARSGVGSMTLQTGRLDDDLSSIGRTMNIDFNNEGDRVDVQITVEGQLEEGGLLEREPIEYTFAREADGSGEFTFTVFANFDDQPLRLRKERLDMAAQWRTDQSGRAVARVTGGDLAPDEVFVNQCWDAAQAQVYVLADVTTQPGDPLLLEGDASQCVIDEGVVDELLPTLSDG